MKIFIKQSSENEGADISCAVFVFAYADCFPMRRLISEITMMRVVTSSAGFPWIVKTKFHDFSMIIS